MAASVYLVYVLEILKFRRVRAWQLRRADPDTSEHDIDEQVERETRDRRVPRRSHDAGSNPIVGLAALAAGPHRLVRFPATQRPRRFPEEVSRTLMTIACISMRGLVPSPGAIRRATVLLAL